VKFQIVISLSLVLFSQFVVAAGRESSIEAAAARYVPGASWRADSVVSGDFSCRGRMEQAILGADQTEIVVAVFLDGTNKRPQVLRYSAKVRNPLSTTLETEDLDYDPKEDLGYGLPGFRRSKTCRGIKLNDGRTDSPHIYWNHNSHRFEDWLR
jgi:hypothetical protein